MILLSSADGSAIRSNAPKIVARSSPVRSTIPALMTRPPGSTRCRVRLRALDLPRAHVMSRLCGSMPVARRVIQKTTNNRTTVRINSRRGFNRPHRFHVIESLSGGLAIYNAPIGLDLSGNFSKGSLSVHDSPAHVGSQNLRQSVHRAGLEFSGTVLTQLNIPKNPHLCSLPAMISPGRPALSALAHVVFASSVN